MNHTINISDELWEAYDGSPSKMRDTLWQALVSTPKKSAREESDLFETPLVLRWDTKCSICRKALLAGETAMYRVDDSTGAKQIVCMDDARESAEMTELDNLVER